MESAPCRYPIWVLRGLLLFVGFELAQLGFELGDALGELLDVFVDAGPRIDRVLDALDRAADLAVDLLLPILEPLLAVIDPLAKRGEAALFLGGFLTGRVEGLGDRRVA